MKRHAEKTVGQAVPEETFIFEESLIGTAAIRAGAAAEKTVSLTDVATKTRLTPAPLRARLLEGEEQLPPAL